MRYNIDGSNVFVAYCNASLADSEDNSNWRNARASEKACMMCVKPTNTCLRRVIDTYGDVDLGWGMRMVPGAKCTVLDSTARLGGENFGREEEEEREGEGESGANFGRGASCQEGQVAEVVAKDTPPPALELFEGEVEQHDGADDRVEGEAEQPQVAEGLGQGARAVRPDEAALVVALRELTKVCW